MKKIIKLISGKGEYRLNIRLNEGQAKKIGDFYINSTCRTITEYARKVLLQLPVKIFYRNKSLDDFKEQMASDFLPKLDKFIEICQQRNCSDSAFLAAIAELNVILKSILSKLTKLIRQCGQ